jgi:xylulokinase
MSYFIGIDVSTTATKALLMDEQGMVIAVASENYAFETPHPLWSEQHPDLWWQGTVESIRAILLNSGIDPAAVQGIGLTGQMHGLVLLDKTGRVVRPAILWNDQRTGVQCDEIRSRLGKERLIKITGNDALTGFTAPKILWIQEKEPDNWNQTRHILLPKDFVRYKLTGHFGTDKAGGAGTLLFNIEERDWSEEVLEALQIPAKYLPKTYEGPEITGELTKEASALTGLPAGIPVVAGGGDQAAQAVGVGAVVPGIIALTLGTSGVVFATVKEPFIESEGRLHAFCHAVPNRWHLMGVMLSAAGSLRWYRDSFAPGLDFDTLLNPVADIPEGSEGLLFLPYLTGERTPYPDPLARGAFVGLTVRHTQAHMIRAVLEGVAYGIRDNFELIKSAGLREIEQVRVSGGGARSNLWRQILADVLSVKLVTVNSTEGAAFGAALLSGVGNGIWSDVEMACRSIVKITGENDPDPSKTHRYHSMYNLYRNLYPALRETFHKLGVYPGA